MILINTVSFDDETIAHLADKQSSIDNEQDYPSKVSRATVLWKNKSRKYFSIVREYLDLMCVGSRRCNYCEDSVADEVEHIKPKSIYPEYCFVSDNYLYSCGACNGPKNNDFAVLDNNDNIINVSRKRDDPIIPPCLGTDAFINPRIENPLDYIILDLTTFIFVAIPTRTPAEIKRANYTIKLLRLNSRDYLINARKHAYISYLDSLELYVRKKLEGVNNQELLARKNELSSRHHPTIWLEMKRQYNSHKKLRELFNQANELLL